MFHCPLSHQLLRGWALCSHSSTWDTGLKEACKEGIPASQDSGGNCYPAPSGSVTRALASHMPCSRLDFRSPLSWERPWASELWRQPEDQLSLASTCSTPALWIFTGPSAPLEARPGHSRGWGDGCGLGTEKGVCEIHACLPTLARGALEAPCSSLAL